jgi:protein phosphatase
VTRALGSDPAVTPDVIEEPCEPGDLLLLCSDGLNTMLPDDRILDAIEDGRDLEAACHRLVGLANDVGGEDNITVVLIRPAHAEQASQSSTPAESAHGSETSASREHDGGS